MNMMKLASGKTVITTEVFLFTHKHVFLLQINMQNFENCLL